MFGEKVEGYPVGMVNEREIRGGAGILFFIGIIVFVLALVNQNFHPAKFMIIAFLMDFVIRLINPKYAPSLVIARLMVSNQTPEFVGAKQKRFAWSIGIVLATSMFITIVILDMRGPINFIVCGLCLVFLFLESAFGICVGCKVYNLFNKEEAQYCAGGVCEVKDKHPIQKTSLMQLVPILGLVGLMAITPMFINFLKDNVEKDCTVPEYAISLGHEEIWKKHNNCE